VIMIEIPDRNFGLYSQAIRQFEEKTEGKYPFGTVVDAPATHGGASDQESEISAPRYFPGTKELYDLLAEVGFGNAYNETYFVRTQTADGKTGLIKEDLFVAEKEFSADVDAEAFTNYRILRSATPTETLDQRPNRYQETA